MSISNILRRVLGGALILLILTLVLPGTVLAHCDSMNGPVVLDATRSLETGVLAPVLKWVNPEDEGTVAAAFADAREVRASGGAAQEVADRYFLETVVRIHRASEGMPYTGLKPAETPINHAVMAADEALASGDPQLLIVHLTQRVHDALNERFAAAASARVAAGQSTEAGRAFVREYVRLTHLAEFLFEATGEAVGDEGDPASPSAHVH